MKPSTLQIHQAADRAFCTVVFRWLVAAVLLALVGVANSFATTFYVHNATETPIFVFLNTTAGWHASFEVPAGETGSEAGFGTYPNNTVAYARIGYVDDIEGYSYVFVPAAPVDMASENAGFFFNEPGNVTDYQQPWSGPPVTGSDYGSLQYALQGFATGFAITMTVFLWAFAQRVLRRMSDTNPSL